MTSRSRGIQLLYFGSIPHVRPLMPIVGAQQKLLYDLLECKKKLVIDTQLYNAQTITTISHTQRIQQDFTQFFVDI